MGGRFGTDKVQPEALGGKATERALRTEERDLEWHESNVREAGENV